MPPSGWSANASTAVSQNWQRPPPLRSLSPALVSLRSCALVGGSQKSSIRFAGLAATIASTRDDADADQQRPRPRSRVRSSRSRRRSSSERTIATAAIVARVKTRTPGAWSAASSPPGRSRKPVFEAHVADQRQGQQADDPEVGEQPLARRPDRDQDREGGDRGEQPAARLRHVEDEDHRHQRRRRGAALAPPVAQSPRARAPSPSRPPSARRGRSSSGSGSRSGPGRRGSRRASRTGRGASAARARRSRSPTSPTREAAKPGAALAVARREDDEREQAGEAARPHDLVERVAGIARPQHRERR